MEKGASEIVKLTERIAKDPKSKLFVPLAEEYKKIGDVEMAITVLQEGLKNNPSYVTARSFLGRLLMDSGDLAGAQKELEEVIKAIPDNLLAQRKLGDLFILTGRNTDALQRYKSALALNPGDKDISSLVADLEAGKDISSRIPKPKVQPAPPAAASPQPKTAPVPPKAAPAAAKTAPAAAASAATPTQQAVTTPAPKKATPAPPAAPAPQKTASAPPAASALEAPAPVGAVPELTDAVEEIVELEDLETPEVVVEPVVPVKLAPSPAPVEAASPAFDLSEGTVVDVPAEAGGMAPAVLEPEAVSWEPPAPDAAPPSMEPEAVSWEPPAPEAVTPGMEPEAESWEPPTAPEPAPAAAQQESSDDINTNTLAELYITQGFYEKAIEIYEGMLADNPSNTVLQQKLEKIRAMAGVAQQNAAFTASPPEPANDGARVDVFAAKAEAAQAAPPAAPAEQPVRQEPSVTAIPRTAPPAAAPPLAGAHGASARRKETIDRLESWLKNIIKEKP